MLGNLKLKKIRPASRLGNRELVGVDFCGQNLKMVYVRRATARKIEIINLIEKNISGLSEDDISKNINLGFKELRPKRPGIIDIIPAHFVITKNIEVPSVDSNEIKKIIDLQANRHTPYSREEIIVDYVDMGVLKHSYTKILLIIVPKKLIRKHFEILNKAGLKIEKIVLPPEALAISAPRLFKLETEEEPASIVHVDKESTEFTVIYKSKILFTRSIPLGIQHLVDQEESHRARLLDELKKSLELYQSENVEKAANRIFLTGAVEASKDLDTHLTAATNLPTTKISYFGDLAFSDKAKNILSSRKDISFLNVIVSVLSHNETKINFIPDDIKMTRTLEQRGKNLIKTGILILTMCVLIFSILISSIYFKETYLELLTSEYQTLNNEAQKLEEDFVKIGIVRNYLSGRGYSLAVLAELYEIIPLDLELSHIRFDNDKVFLGGTAESMSTVFNFVTNMEDSRYFGEVQTRRTTKRKDGLKDVTDFEISAIVTKEVS